MPKPKYPESNESKDEYMSRCVTSVMNEGKNRDQAVAICYSYWRESKRKDNK